MFQKNLARDVALYVALCLATILCVLNVAAVAQAEQPRDAQALVDLLRSRISQDWTPTFPRPHDVLAAEQRDTRLILFKKDAQDWNSPDAIAWSWDPLKVLPQDQGRWFMHISECKPALGDTCAMVAASSGGIALIRIEDGAVLFYGNAGGNTHSVAMTPDGNFVSASSTGAYLALFVNKGDLKTAADAPTPVAKKIPFFDAHGVVWDAKRSLLWALGGKEIAAFEYVGDKENPDLKEVWREELTGTAYGGHDLYPAPGFDALMTTGRGVNVFDPEKRVFYEIAAMRGVKSIGVAKDGQTIMQRATEEWWSDSIFYGDSENHKVGVYDGAKFYKARWFAPNEFSESQSE